MENETDPAILARREKNISLGKNTDIYAKYIQAIPKQNRVKGSPSTPIKEKRYSRRQWDELIKHWKIKLYDWERGTIGTPCAVNEGSESKDKEVLSLNMARSKKKRNKGPKLAKANTDQNETNPTILARR